MLSTTNSISASSIACGPSGRAIAEAIDSDLLNAIQATSTWKGKPMPPISLQQSGLLKRELRGFSRFFRDESNSEHEHAAKFAEYIIARGQSVALQGVDAPLQSWASPEDVMATAFQMEVDVTASLQQLYSMAERVNDTRTTVFLDPMVEMQTQSEHEFAHLLDG